MRGSGGSLPALIVLVAVSASSAVAGEFTGRVIGVASGNLIQVSSAGARLTVRLAGVECPEKGQPYSDEAERFTSDLTRKTVVRVKVTDRDRAGRPVGEVTLMDGRNLNQEVLRAGYAWHSQSSHDEALRKLEAEARAAKRGLWADPNPVPPWEHRYRKRRERPRQRGRTT